MKILTTIFKPIMILVSKIKWPFGKKYSIDKHLITPYLLCGDAILTYTPKELGSFFIPSNQEHAILYLGNERTLEAVTKEVQINSLEISLKGKKELWVYRLIGVEKNHCKSINEMAENFLWLLYDWDFTDNAKWYCYEIVLHILSCITGYKFTKYKSLLLDIYNYKSFSRDNRFKLILCVKDGKLELYD